MLESTARAVTVGTTPVDLKTGGQTRAIMVYNDSTTTVYLGDSSVTAASGLPLQPSSYFGLDAAAMKLEGETLPSIYAVVSSGTASVRVLEVKS